MHRDGGSLSAPDRSLLRLTYEIPPIGFLLLFSPNGGNLLAVRLKPLLPLKPSLRRLASLSAARMNWYCLHTKPQKEALTALYLNESLGLETYFPQLKRQRVIRRVRRTVMSALFPRYLFCRFDAAYQYRSVRYAPDILDVVRFGEQPTVVNEAIIDDLKSWAGEGVDLISIEPQLKAGERVIISQGPMQGLEAVILQERNDRDRVAVLLGVLEFSAQISISRAHLQRVS